MPSQIRDFLQECFDASELKFDHRWRKYARFVAGIDETKDDGYSIIGGFIGNGTSEVEIGEPKLILVAAEVGSARNRNTYYRVLTMNADGTLTLTDINENDEKKGWALRIRQPLKALLLSINPQAKIITKSIPTAQQVAVAKKSPDEPWRFKLGFDQTVYDTLAIYKKRFPDLSYSQITMMAFASFNVSLLEVDQKKQTRLEVDQKKQNQ